MPDTTTSSWGSSMFRWDARKKQKRHFAMRWRRSLDCPRHSLNSRDLSCGAEKRTKLCKKQIRPKNSLQKPRAFIWSVRKSWNEWDARRKPSRNLQPHANLWSVAWKGIVRTRKAKLFSIRSWHANPEAFSPKKCVRTDCLSVNYFSLHAVVVCE